MRYTMIRFQGSFSDCCTAVAAVFRSLPQHGQEDVWTDVALAEKYCNEYPVERLDCGGYKRPETANSGCRGVTLRTPGGRLVEFVPPAAGDDYQYWIVDFGREGSEFAARRLLGVLQAFDLQVIATESVATPAESPSTDDEPLAVGERYGLGDRYGYPPATVVRSADGDYTIERLSGDLRQTVTASISAAEAAAMIRSSEQTT